ncbi:MAG: sugar ABC transporter permease [Pseudomonadota bacterium]
MTPRGLGHERRRSAVLFLLPMTAILILVAGWPLARTIWFSLTDARLSDLGDYAFVGLENFWNPDWGGLIADDGWWQAVGNTLWFAAVSVSLETLLGLVVALALSVRFPMRGLVRAAVLIPWAIPTIVSAKMWGWMLHDQYGVVNWMLLGAGVIDTSLAWTADADLALWSVVMIDVWKTTPFMALLILAALQMLPGDIYEAARLDGVPPLTVFWHVTLPLIWPALVVAVIFRALDALRMFDLVYALTGNAEDTAMMSVFARQQLVDFQDVGYGSAASTVLFLIIACLIGVILTLGRVRLTDEAR